MHRVGAPPADVPALVRGHRRRSAAAARGTVDPPAGGRRRDAPRTAPSPWGSWRASTGWLAELPAAGVRPRRGPRRQHGRRHRLPRGPLRHGPLRHRPLRLPARRRRCRRAFAAAGRRAAAAGHVAAGPGGLGAHAGGRGAPLLRPPAAAARALGGGHRAHRLRRRRARAPCSPAATRADRGPAPARWPAWSPWTRSWWTAGTTPRCAPGDEVVLLGRQGDEEITADEWAGLLGTISYEVLCGIGPRVPRVAVNGPSRAGGRRRPARPERALEAHGDRTLGRG